MRFKKGDICFYCGKYGIDKLKVESIEEYESEKVYKMENNQMRYYGGNLFTKEEMQLKLKTEYENKLKELED